jgi:hypothetical protein
MGQEKQIRESQAQEPSAQKQPSAELDQKALEEVSGGACVKGEHIKDGQITVRP